MCRRRATVARGRVIRTLVIACTELDLVTRFKLHIDNRSVTILDSDQTTCTLRVVRVNDTAYLQ